MEGTIKMVKYLIATILASLILCAIIWFGAEYFIVNTIDNLFTQINIEDIK
jgi:hypothetical protein